MKKRIFSMLLALCMVVSMLPLGSIRARATVQDYPEGNINNPAKLVTGENVAVLEEVNSDGYYYTWTAEGTGTLTITIETTAPGWQYCINNLSKGQYGDGQYSDSDPLVNPAVVEVAAGDELQIRVNTYDPRDMFATPAGTVTLTAQWKPRAVAAIDGTEYSSLDEALQVAFAAETALTVKLLQDMTWSGMVMKANLDLNSHVLTVDHHLVVFDNAQILDSSESNSGLLVLTETAQKYLKLPINNVQLPVYGSRIGVEDSRKGYAFVEVEKFNSAVRGDGSDFAFQPVFEPVAVAALAENLAESRVKVIVRVSWANDKGEARSQDFLYSDALVQSFLDSYDAAGDRFGEMFTLKLKSDLLQDFSFQVLVKSAIGSTIASDSLRNSAE